MTTPTPTHDLAIARAERDAWQSTCEELHRAIAGRDVEIEAHLGRIEAAIRAQAETTTALVTADRELAKLRAELAELRMGYVDVCDAIAAETHGPAHAASIARETRQERDRLRAEVAELTVTRDRLLAREHEDGRLHAQLRAEVAELRARPVLDLDGRTFEDALEAGFWRFDALRSGHGRGPHLEGSKVDDREAFKMAMRRAVHGLGPATLPSPDRAEELTAAIYGAVERAERAMTPGPWEAKIYTTHVAGTSQETQWHEAIAGGPSSGTVVCETEWSVFEDESAIGAANIRGIVALRNAAPALIAEVRALRAAAEEREADMHARIRAGYDKTVADAWRAEVAPTLVAVSDEELATAYSVAHDQPIPRMAPLRDRTIAGIRAVRAKFGAAEVTEERLAGALAISIPPATGQRAKTCPELARDAIAYLRATAAKGG